jgi:hypothetical protein
MSYFERLIENSKALEEAPAEGLSAFHFNGQDVLRNRIEQVDLVSGSIAEEAEIASLPFIEAIFEKFHEDEVLEKIPAQGMMGDVGGVLNPDEISRQPDIVEVELGGFDQTLPDIAVIRFQ